MMLGPTTPCYAPPREEAPPPRRLRRPGHARSPREPRRRREPLRAPHGSLGDDLSATAREAAADAILLASPKTEVCLAIYKKLRKDPELSRASLIVCATPGEGMPAKGTRRTCSRCPESSTRSSARSSSTTQLDAAGSSSPTTSRCCAGCPELPLQRGLRGRRGERRRRGHQGARSEGPDLAITDVKMPRTDGYEVCRALKEDKEHAARAGSDRLGARWRVRRGPRLPGRSQRFLAEAPLDLEELRERIDAIFRGIQTRGRENVLLVVHRRRRAERAPVRALPAGLRGDRRIRRGEGLVLARELVPSLVIVDAQHRVSTPAPSEAPPRDPRTREVALVLLLGKGPRSRARGARMWAAAPQKPYTIDRLVTTSSRSWASGG